MWVTGDGTEDISCRIDPACLTPHQSTTGVFSKDQAASFLQSLKLHFIGFLVYPAVFLKNPNFPLKIGQIPPVIDPTIAGDVLFDTEFEVCVVIYNSLVSQEGPFNFPATQSFYFPEKFLHT